MRKVNPDFSKAEYTYKASSALSIVLSIVLYKVLKNRNLHISTKYIKIIRWVVLTKEAHSFHFLIHLKMFEKALRWDVEIIKENT